MAEPVRKPCTVCARREANDDYGQHIRQRPFFPELSTGRCNFPPFLAARSFISPHPFRVEDEFEDGHYVIRAEIPGVDPGTDVRITVGNDTLTIDAERTVDKSDKTRSEFQHGAFHRAMHSP